ncbi:hypothetical protein BGZ70_006335 [Mortierella alpina]|uniref:Uncharacterized protein n=1 Tax=Mortierella alpina TaxID=64518 RepID=A0A9P6J887_MORAP|nr:hypothetical protein BGZ70_006335 [Mortierella alpina]
MPEQPFAASRLAKSRENYKTDEEDLGRKPSPVLQAERFFDTPAKTFDLDAVEHEYDEFGLAIEPTSNGNDTEELIRDQEMESTRGPSRLVSGHRATSDGGSSTSLLFGQKPNQSRQGRPTSSLFPNTRSDHGLTLAKPMRGFSLEDFEGETVETEAGQGSVAEEKTAKDLNSPSMPHMDIPAQDAQSPVVARRPLDQERDEHEQEDQEQEEHEREDQVQEEVEEVEEMDRLHEQDRETPESPLTHTETLEQKQKPSGSLFPDSQPGKGLILAGHGISSDNVFANDEEEEEELAPLPSLSDLLAASTPRSEQGLSIAHVKVVVESTAPENVNVERWDQLDEGDSDSEETNTFSAHRTQDAPSLPSSAAPMECSEDESPFAPFVRSTSRQPSAPLADVSEIESDDNIKAGQPKDGDTSESDDATTLLRSFGKVAAGAGAFAVGGALLKSFMLDRDSGDEPSASSDTKPSQMYPSLPEQKPAYSTLSTEPVQSSSEDNLTLDEGAGVGIRRGRSVEKASDDDASTSQYTLLEKGKQVSRDVMEGSDDHSHIWNDLPPITSVMDRESTGRERTALFSMLSPTPVSPPAHADDPRTRIYPAAPPAPWTPESKTSLSQRRPQAFENVSVTSKNDPNLAFMSSTRKAPVASQSPLKAGAKSLLSDFADETPKAANTTHLPTMTLPADPSKAPVLRGHYELPSIKKVDQWKSKNALAPNAFRRLFINICALIGSRIVMKAHVYRSAVKVLSSLTGPVVFYWTEWAVILLFLFNIGEVLLSYMRSSNSFENLPLTPSQRALLGLDPIVTKVPGAVPIFKKSTVAPKNLSERPSIKSTYVNQSQGVFTSTRTPFQKPPVGSVLSEYRDAATILNKSMSRTFNQPTVQDKSDLRRLMMNVEAREELRAERKTVDTDSSKRPFALQGAFGMQQSGMDMSGQGADSSTRPDLLASLNSRGPVSRYQPALRTTLSKDRTSKTDLQKDGLYVVGHSKVLKNLKLSEEQLDRWVFNLRKWMWNMVVKPVCSEMEIVDEELAKQGLSYLDCKSATMFYTAGPPPQNATAGSNASTAAAAAAPAAAPLNNTLGWGAASIATTRAPSAFASAAPQSQLPVSLQDLEARYGESRIVKQRMILEQYLAIPGFANRKYVVERLRAMGPLLTHFIWDSHGVTWDGGKKSWTPDLPTDAQIIMHLFTVYMDLAMPSHPSMTLDRFPFSYKYYVPMEAKPDHSTALQIKQTLKNPPNYNLVVDGSTVWEVVPKRLNVWYTLVLFIYMVMKESGGYVGQLNIGTQMMGLGDVVEGYDL